MAKPLLAPKFRCRMCKEWSRMRGPLYRYLHRSALDSARHVAEAMARRGPKKSQGPRKK